MSVCLKNNRIYIGGVSSAPTQNVQAGDVYYNSTEDVLYRCDQNGDWVEIGSGSGITVSSTAPNVRVGKNRGQGWFDTTRGAMYVWDKQSWIELLDPDSASKTFITSTEPTEDGQGDYWWNPTNKEFKLWDGGTWRLVSGDPELYDQLTELTDVTNSGTVGQMLQANGDGTFTFVDMNRTLAGLLDITNATSTTDQYALTSNGNGTFTFSPRIRNLDDLTDVTGSTTTDQILVSLGSGTYGFVDHEHQLDDQNQITDVDASNAQLDYVLKSDFDGTYSFTDQTCLMAYGENPPSNPLVGDLWFDTGDSNSPTEDIVGLFIWDGYNWISTGGPVMSPAGGATTVTLDSSAAGAATINGTTAFQEIRTSDYISDGETFEIPSDVWIWSNNTSTAALIVDTDNATIVNNGKIIGKGGNAGGGAGGPAIQVTASGVTITNASGAYIAGGGGGGATAIGGGGAGGGGAGGTIGSAGSNGSGSTSVYLSTGSSIFFNGNGCTNVQGMCFGFVSVTATAGAAAGGNQGGASGSTQGVSGYVTCYVPACDINNGGQTFQQAGLTPHTRNASGTASFTGGGGGRVLSPTNAQGAGTYGGGAWGAAGSGGGGAGGAAVSGSYTQGTWSGTVYGSS